jgi:hypothetical protein
MSSRLHFVSQTFVSLCACLALMLPTAGVAQVALQCTVADTKGFPAFLKKFEEDIGFQRSRIALPLVVREGDYIVQGVSIALWDIEHIKALDWPLILPRKDRNKEGVSEEVLLHTQRYSEVLQEGPPETDSYRLLYKFRNVGGCWFLEELHDRSL